jgi:hypothetical protein
MKENQTQTENPMDFIGNISELARELLQKPQSDPSSLCINQSRTINNVRVNVIVSSPKSPGILRRLLAKFF